MSAFNTVRAKVECPNCHQRVEQGIQFKYGDTWQIEYALGDEIRWGGNDIGLRGAGRVTVHGGGEGCPSCHVIGADYVVVIEHDVLISVEPAPPGPPPTTDGELYRIEEPGASWPETWADKQW
jgi:hypothetical protein